MDPETVEGPVETPAPAAVKKLGKYELLEIVGRGAMGEVYKAQDPLIGRLVALKTITSGLVGRPDLLERFYLEARSAGTLQHPNIVTVYELGQEGETPFIAMEFLEGESLEKIIERRTVMSLSHKLSHIMPVCRALDFAHKRHVIHRDIKPANVMVTKDGRVKVVDFGIARLNDSSSLTQTNTIIGTLGYMSPQQIRGERADERSDIWATGVMLYELLTCQRPFEGANQAALMMSIANEDGLPASIKNYVPDCGPALEALVAKMLEKNAHQRYQTMEQVIRDFESVVRRLQLRNTPGTVAASQEAPPTSIQGTVYSGPPPAQAIGQRQDETQLSQLPLPRTSAAAPAATRPRVIAAPSLADKLMSQKMPIVMSLSVVALLVILSLVFKSHRSALSDAGLPAAVPVSETSAANVPPPAPARSVPTAPGVIATVDELSQPWSSKDFTFRNDATGESVPAMVVRLPRGGYWGFSLIEPYGRCQLQYVTDLDRLAKKYGYPADHPLIVDPCSDTLFDLLRYGGPMNAEVRGDIVHGSSLRPPVAIEIQERGNSILAVKMEE
jgi:serine/threonine protein kinase